MSNFKQSLMEKWITKFFSIYGNEIEKILNEKEIKVLKRRFIYKNSYKQTGEFYGVTWERIRQIEHKAVKKLDENAQKFSHMYKI